MGFTFIIPKLGKSLLNSPHCHECDGREQPGRRFCFQSFCLWTEQHGGFPRSGVHVRILRKSLCPYFRGYFTWPRPGAVSAETVDPEIGMGWCCSCRSKGSPLQAQKHCTRRKSIWKRQLHVCIQKLQACLASLVATPSPASSGTMSMWQNIFAVKIEEMHVTDPWTLLEDDALQVQACKPGWKEFVQRRALGR